MKTFDAIIIGFGKAGKTLAAEMAKRGEKVALIEKSEMMYGGTCINIGCIPTKALVHSAKLAAESGSGMKRELYREAIKRKNGITSALRARNYHNMADNPNITLFNGMGSFISADEVAVDTAEGRAILKSDKIIIDTGAETVLPTINGADGRNVFNSSTIMDLEELPERLVIVGGGYIGLEFASIYSSFGSQVTVLEGSPEFIPREDRDVASCVKETMERNGVSFQLGVKVLAIEDAESIKIVKYSYNGEDKVHELRADAVMLATGRRPYTDGLNLEASGIEKAANGAIKVDERLKTSNPNVWAAGDVKGGLQFTYVSLDDYRIIRDEIYGCGARHADDRDPVQYSVFIDPPLSRIGLGEDEAAKKGLNVKVNKIVVSTIPRTLTTGETDGVLKAVIDADSNEILGCTLFCAESHEVINSVAIAMKAGLKADFLKNFIFTHPSMSEALNGLFV